MAAATADRGELHDAANPFSAGTALYDTFFGAFQRRLIALAGLGRLAQ